MGHHQSIIKPHIHIKPFRLTFINSHYIDHTNAGVRPMGMSKMIPCHLLIFISCSCLVMNEDSVTVGKWPIFGPAFFNLFNLYLTTVGKDPLRSRPLK